MAAAVKPALPFQVGDWAKLNYGVSWGLVQIAEDRGPLGRHGRHIYYVRANSGEDARGFDASEDDLQPFDWDEAVEYLASGGLKGILEQGSRGRNRPSVWWTLTPDGKLTHSYSPEIGMVGGLVIPPADQTLHDGKIFLPAVPEVREFLRDLGLDPQQADTVIESVGTAPSPPG